MENFSEAALNNYLASIADNQLELQNFANDLQADFINAFETRFIMDPELISSLEGWPQAIRDVLIQVALSTAQLHEQYDTDPVDMTVSGFEAPEGISSPTTTGNLEVGGSISGTYDSSTGHLKVKAEVHAKWYIC